MLNLNKKIRKLNKKSFLICYLIWLGQFLLVGLTYAIWGISVFGPWLTANILVFFYIYWIFITGPRQQKELRKLLSHLYYLRGGRDMLESFTKRMETKKEEERKKAEIKKGIKKWGKGGKKKKK